MQIVPRHALSAALQRAGLDASTRDFLVPEAVHRVTVREMDPPLFTGGPHRHASHGSREGPFPVCDRPSLSRVIPKIYGAFGVERVLVSIPDGTFWLNNKVLAAYLWKVPDAQAVSMFLRRRGLTDRFRGGFRVRRSEFTPVLPRLAAGAFAGGSNVLFAAECHIRLTVLACQQFDLHLASPEKSTLDAAAAVAGQFGLHVESVDVPELPDVAPLWHP